MVSCDLPFCTARPSYQIEVSTWDGYDEASTARTCSSHLKPILLIAGGDVERALEERDADA